MSLSQLPTELLVAIFSYSGSLDQATSLSRTCRRLRAIKEDHEAFIFVRVAPRCLMYYHDLELLVATQAKHSPNEEYQQMQKNAVVVSHAADLYEACTHPRQIDVTKWTARQPQPTIEHLSKNERRRFKSFFYTALVLAAHPTGASRLWMYDTITLRKLFCVAMIIEWVIELTDGQQGQLGIDDKHWLNVLQNLNFNYEKKRRRLTPLYNHRARAVPDASMVVFDEWQGDLRNLPDKL